MPDLPLPGCQVAYRAMLGPVSVGGPVLEVNEAAARGGAGRHGSGGLPSVGRRQAAPAGVMANTVMSGPGPLARRRWMQHAPGLPPDRALRKKHV